MYKQHFKFLNSFQEDTVEDYNPLKRTRTGFSLIDPYVLHDEINRNLSNAPATVNVINIRNYPNDNATDLDNNYAKRNLPL